MITFGEGAQTCVIEPRDFESPPIRAQFRATGTATAGSFNAMGSGDQLDVTVLDRVQSRRIELARCQLCDAVTTSLSASSSCMSRRSSSVAGRHRRAGPGASG